MAEPASTAAAGALALWQAMTLTAPGAPGPAAPAGALPSADATAAWREMTMAPPGMGTGADGAASGFAPLPAPGRAGGYHAPTTGSRAGMPPATTPLLDNPTQVPQAKQGTGTAPPRPPLTDAEALAVAGHDPALAPQVPPATPEANRALTVDEKRFAQGNALLDAAYAGGHAVAPHLAAGMKPPADGAAPDGGVRLEGYRIAWTESFDNGAGVLSRVWGPGVDTGVPGQVTIRLVEGDIDSGAMVPPTGRDAGFGYGLYTFDLSLAGTAPGPYALLWPSTDVWPGPEMDLVERLDGGALYATLHRRGADGGDAYESIGLDGVDGGGRHTYQYLWEPGRLSVFVDGRAMGSFTENVPRSAADGGENAAPGIGMQTWRHVAQQGGENAITLYGMSYEAPE